MTTWIAFLRAVNVGGTGLLAMRDLRAACKATGLKDPRTHGASGNALFESDLSEGAVHDALAPRLEALVGRPVDLVLRTSRELEAVLAANPFPNADRSRTVVFLLPSPPPPDALSAVAGQADEEVRLGRREVYVHYPEGQGVSRLRIPAARDGTARNINTLVRLVGLARNGASPKG